MNPTNKYKNLITGRKANLPAGTGKTRKYRNVPTIYRGERFDSKAEMERYQVLEILAYDVLAISRLQRQVKFILLDKCVLENGARQRAITYTVDFLYVEQVNGKMIAEDVKGKETQQGNVRIKMFRALYPNIELRIIRKAKR
jgi:hypothetical protein